jgi:site-specific DNA-methyltransferase (adenine-specific)
VSLMAVAESRSLKANATIRAGDAVDLLRELKDGSVDLIVTAPPYESLEQHRAIGTTTRLTKSKASSNAWFAIFPNRRFPELMKQAWRVLATNRHAYFFCDETTLFPLVDAARGAGFRFWKSLVWVKTKRTPMTEVGTNAEDVAYRTVNIGMGYHWRNSTERVLFLEKGKRNLNNRGWPDVLFGPRGLSKDYPTEKPPSVIRRLVANSSRVGEIVLDPFCGSGVVGEVALSLARGAILFDLDGEPARKRIGGGHASNPEEAS